MSEFILEKKLLDAGFAGLFLKGENSLSHAIWANGKIVNKLKKIIFSGSSSDYGKFLAAEMLNKYDVPQDENACTILAEVYTNMLKRSGGNAENRVEINANLWGFLYEMDDPGYLGKHLIRFGNTAVPFLAGLLEDNNNMLYEGSQEATIGNQYQYRVKDFAAFYLSKIRNLPVKFYQEKDKRDKEIQRLKETINQ